MLLNIEASTSVVLTLRYKKLEKYVTLKPNYVHVDIGICRNSDRLSSSNFHNFLRLILEEKKKRYA